MAVGTFSRIEWWVYSRWILVNFNCVSVVKLGLTITFWWQSNALFSEILDAFSKSTIYAPKWAKAWHTWALFNTAVMSHYISKGQIASQFVAAAVTGYFHSIACAANAKGVDDSLQVKCACFHWFHVSRTKPVSFLHLFMPHRLGSIYDICWVRSFLQH